MAFPVLSNQDAVKDFYRIHSNFWNSKSCISFFPKKRKEQKQKNTNQKKNQIKPKQLSVSARCIYCLPTKKKLIIKVRIMKKWFLHSLSLWFQGGTTEFGEGQSRSLRSQGTSFTHIYHKYLLLRQHFLCFGHFCKAWKLGHQTIQKRGPFSANVVVPVLDMPVWSLYWVEGHAGGGWGWLE